MIVPIRIAMFERGGSGVPSTSYLTDLAGMTAYRHTISDQFGFETMQATLTLSLDDGMDWLERGLMRSCIAFSPDGDIVWEGFLETIDCTFGQERRSVSLQNMANRIKIKFTDPVGTPQNSTFDDAASQGMYGVKNTVVTLPVTSINGAFQKGNRVLNTYKQPRTRATSTLATGSIGRVQATFSFVGWYSTLDWVLTERTSTIATITSTQVGDLLQNSAPGIGATNQFISTSREHIRNTGISDVETIARDTAYRKKVEALLDQGDSNSNSLAWGVYEFREFYLDGAAENVPDTYHYQRALGSSELLDIYGNRVPFWLARPNKNYQVLGLLDSVANPVTTNDAIGRSYVARVTCELGHDQWSLSLEGRGDTSIDKLLAHLR